VTSEYSCGWCDTIRQRLRGELLDRLQSHFHYAPRNGANLNPNLNPNRVVPLWNSLPNDVVMADNINVFKKRLDKFWSSYNFVYLFGLSHLRPEV